VLVILATAALVVGLEQSIDIVFLRMLAALFIFAGFTAAAFLITKAQVGAVLGGNPSIPALILAFLAGILAWVPGTWLLLVFSQSLNLLFGILPGAQGTTATFFGQALVYAIIIPLGEGLLFFGFILSSARGIGRWTGVWLTAALFGLFGFFSDKFGMSAIPTYFLLGLVGGTLVTWSGSVWPGILVLSGFELGEKIIGSALINLLLSGSGQFSDLGSFGWLTAVALSAFLVFALTRIARAFRSDRTPPIPAPPGQSWWLPLVIVVVVVLLVGHSEIQLRQQNPQIPIQSQGNVGSAPPVAPPVQATPSATP